MGSNMIIAIVVGAILVIVGFSLWPVLNGASNSLYSYFRDSCDDSNGNRFLRAYVEDTTTSALPSNPNRYIYYSDPGQHGGSGMVLEEGSGACQSPATTTSGLTAGTVNLVNEHGERIQSGVTLSLIHI